MILRNYYAESRSLFAREMRHYSTCNIPWHDDDKCIYKTGQQGSKLHQQLP